MPPMSTTQAPAGWYPINGQQRYWDGSQWTDHYAPVQVVMVNRYRNGAGITGFVLGVVSWLFAITIIGILVAIPAAIVGIAFAIVGTVAAKKTGTGWSMSIIGLALNALIVLPVVWNLIR